MDNDAMACCFFPPPTGYTLKADEGEEKGSKVWTRKPGNSRESVKAKAGRRRDELQLYCDSLLEEHEEDLIEAIRQGVLDDTESSQDANRVLCETLSRDCVQKPRKKDRKSKRKTDPEQEQMPDTSQEL